MKKVLIIVCIVMILALVAGLGSTLFVSKGASSDSEDIPTVIPSSSSSGTSDGGNMSVDPQPVEFVSTVDLSDKTYIAFGDSITWGLCNYGLEHSIRMEKPYPTLVAEKLELQSYLNLGQSGATFCSNDLGFYNMTERILSRTESADIVSVMLGVNDMIRCLPLGTIDDRDNTTIYGSLYLIMEHFSTYYPDSFVFFMTPLNIRYRDGDGYRDNRVGFSLYDVSCAIKQMAKKYDYPVLDLFSFGSYSLEAFDEESDGVHPSQEFIQDYTAPMIAQFINDHFDPDR